MKLPVLPSDAMRCDGLRATMAARQCVSNASREMRRPLACMGCALGAQVRAALGAPEPPEYRPIRGNLMFPPTPPQCSVVGCERTAVMFSAHGVATEPFCAGHGSAARASVRRGRSVTPRVDPADAQARELTAQGMSRLVRHHGSQGAAAAALGVSTGKVSGALRGLATRELGAIVAGAVSALPTTTAKRTDHVAAWAAHGDRTKGGGA